MGNATGALTRIVAFTEDTYNTVPAVPDGRLLAVQNFNLRASEGRESDPTLSGYRGQSRSTAGRREVGGPSLASIAPEDIGFWLAHIIGTPTTTEIGRASCRERVCQYV